MFAAATALGRRRDAPRRRLVGHEERVRYARGEVFVASRVVVVPHVPVRRHLPEGRGREGPLRGRLIGRRAEQHATRGVARKAAFEEKRTWVDPQLRP